MFTKSNPGTGRVKGSKNSTPTHCLKKLLEDAFIRNQSAALAKIDKMFQGDDMSDFKFMLTLKASIEPKQPFVINNVENHTHLTHVEFKSKSDSEIIEFLTGRTNGLTHKPA